MSRTANSRRLRAVSLRKLVVSVEAPALSRMAPRARICSSAEYTGLRTSRTGRPNRRASGRRRRSLPRPGRRRRPRWRARTGPWHNARACLSLVGSECSHVMWSLASCEACGSRPWLHHLQVRYGDIAGARRQPGSCQVRAAASSNTSPLALQQTTAQCRIVGRFLPPLRGRRDQLPVDQRDGETVVALDADGLDRRGAEPGLGGQRSLKRRTPWTSGSLEAASRTLPARTTLSATIIVPGRDSLSDHSR
jgi:hypothetical protein